MDWANHLDLDMKFAVGTLLEKGSVTPMFVLHQRDGQTLAIVTPFFSEEDKIAVLEYLRLMCIAHDIVGVSAISEAWMVLAKPDVRLDEIKPSESPDRIEVITVGMTYRDEERGVRKTLSAIAEIVRDGRGNVTSTKPFDSGDLDSKGRFVDILPINRPSPGQQERARRQVARVMGTSSSRM